MKRISFLALFIIFLTFFTLNAFSIETINYLSGNELGEGGVVAAGSGTRYGPLSRGPLPEGIAKTFRGGSYSGVQLADDTVLYRVHGGKAGEIGQFWTRTPPAGSLQSRIDLALKPEWGNTATQVARIQVPAGTTIYEGFAAGQGGGSQVVIPSVNPAWVVP